MMEHSFCFAVALVATSFVLLEAQLCYRCFNGNWCNKFTDPDFQSNVLTVACPASTNLRHQYHGDNPLVTRILDSFELVANHSSNFLDHDDSETTWGCITATIHEDHEIHTARMCLNNAATICPTVQAVILNPDVNDVPSDLVLDCVGCVGSLCNNHTFTEEEEITTPTTSTSPATITTPDITTIPAPTTTPDVTTTPAPTTTPDVTTTPAPTTTPDVTTTPAPTTTPDVTTPVPITIPDTTTTSIGTTTNSSDTTISFSSITTSTQQPTITPETTQPPPTSKESSSTETSSFEPTSPFTTPPSPSEGSVVTTTTPSETTVKTDSGLSLMVSYCLLGLAILVDCLIF